MQEKFSPHSIPEHTNQIDIVLWYCSPSGQLAFGRRDTETHCRLHLLKFHRKQFGILHGIHSLHTISKIHFKNGWPIHWLDHAHIPQSNLKQSNRALHRENFHKSECHLVSVGDTDILDESWWLRSCSGNTQFLSTQFQHHRGRSTGKIQFKIEWALF